MIAFQDFVPRVTKRGFFQLEIESLHEALRKANEWLARTGVDLVNVETVTLPNIWAEEGSTDPALGTSGDMMNEWNQVIRVWYRS